MIFDTMIDFHQGFLTIFLEYHIIAKTRGLSKMSIVAQTLIFRNDSTSAEAKFSQNSSFTFNNIAPGGTSEPVIIKLDVSGVYQITHIKLGITDIKDITFGNKVFGIYSSYYFNPKIPITTYFQGVSDGTSASPYNVDINNKDSKSSIYVYLNVNLPKDTSIEAIVLKYRWFFDYS